MDFSSFDMPPPGADFEPASHDDQEPGEFEIVSDEDYFDAYLTGADLRELGIQESSAGVGWRVFRSARSLVEEYRASRSAMDRGRPEAAERLKAATARLLQATRVALTGFIGWKDPNGGEP